MFISWFFSFSVHTFRLNKLDISASEDDNFYMNRKIGVFLIFWSFLFVFFSVGVNADIYSWVDEKGITHYSTTPPKGDTDLEVKVRPTTSTKTETTLKTNIKTKLKSVISPTSKKKVELYITSWCPYCQKAIAFFNSQKNVELTIYDIEKDAEAAKRKSKLDRKKGVPFAVIDGKHYVHGYSEEYYKEVLALKD